jgi:hypothetical protein
VSEPDFANGVTLFGFRVPAFISRRADTRVTLQNGESLVIAGLFRDIRVENTNKIPYVADIPYLGYLFRSTSYTRTKNELMIVVRPRLADATPPGVSVAVPDREPFRHSDVRSQRTDASFTRPRVTRRAPTGSVTRDASVDPEGDPPVHGWSVQVGATPDRTSAEALATGLQQKGHQAYVVTVTRAGAPPLHRVRIGPYTTIEDAIQGASRIRKEPGIQEAIVVSE